jgi:hypothetical protein
VGRELEPYFVYLRNRTAFGLIVVALGIGGILQTGTLLPSKSWDRLLMPFKETVTLVMDLPDVEELRIPYSGRFIDLGYHHTYKGGEWVGRIDRRAYYEMTPQLRALIFKAGKLDRFPPVPDVPLTKGYFKLLLFLGVLPATVLLGLLARFFGRAETRFRQGAAGDAAPAEAAAGSALHGIAAGRRAFGKRS